jgi:FAD/FMN-containing dehydrogenase
MEEIYKLLKSKVLGKVVWGNKGEEYCRDFGNRICKQPKIAAFVTCGDDVREIFKIASDYKIPLSIRGAGHSCNGQTLSESLVIINSPSNDENLAHINEDGSVEVFSHLTWEALERKLNAKGLSTPVLTSNPFQTTIGGTLSVGGYGIRSLHYGAQIDHVLKLKIILPTGLSLWCSPNEYDHLFKFSLATSGSLGFIEKVVLKTIPYHFLSAKNSQSITNLPEFLEYVKQRPSWCHFIAGDRKKKKFIDTSKDVQYLIHDLIEPWLKTYLGHQHFWCDYVLSIENVKEFEALVEKLKTPQISSHLKFIYYLAICRPQNAPDLPFHPAPLKDVIYVSVGHYFNILDDPKIYSEIMRFKNEVLDCCIQLGGRPYLYGSFDLNEKKFDLIYRKNYKDLKMLKNTYDPNHLLRNGISMETHQ